MDIRLVTIVIALCLPLSALAQQDESSPAQERQDQTEEVLVIGDRSLLQLRTRMMKAEKNAYDIFNKFNDEGRFRISCSMHQPTGTRFETQICQPDFELEATAAHGRDYWESLRALLDPDNLDYSPPVQAQPQEAVIARQLPAYKRKIRQVAEEHPEFLEAVIQYSRTREQYEEMTRTGETEH